MPHFLRVVAIVLGLGAVPAKADFHLWFINELYSNADGTVQFLELTAQSGGQQFLSGHQLSAAGTAGGNSLFTFPSDLPGDTGGRRMLIATQGFAALGIVTPDYVVPNNFFFPAGGTVNFASASILQHGALPTDNRSINQNGNPQTPTPQNFNGVIGTIGATPTPPALNFQGLWYRSPAESESGWGINIAHQGDIFFVTWFTYDTDGTQMWLVGPDVRRTTGTTYIGNLFRTTGPAFNSVPFNPTLVGVTPVGSVTLTFSDSNNGNFGYTVNGITQTKAITRQIFDTPPTCTAGGSPGAITYFQDLWYAAPAESESGWGLNITHQGNIMFLTWFTYDSTGRGMWIVGPRMEQVTGNTYSGGLFRTTGPAFNANPWNPAGVSASQVGSATFNFTSPSTATFNYTVNGITQTKNITKQVFGIPATVCR